MLLLASHVWVCLEVQQGAHPVALQTLISLNPGLHGCLQDLDVQIKFHFCAGQNEVSWHLIDVGPNEAKHCCDDGMLCSKLVPDVVGQSLGLQGAQVAVH